MAIEVTCAFGLLGSSDVTAKVTRLWSITVRGEDAASHAASARLVHDHDPITAGAKVMMTTSVRFLARGSTLIGLQNVSITRVALVDGRPCVEVGCPRGSAQAYP